MPNKYSHALVLSRYESKGFITSSRPPPAPRHTSPSSHHSYSLSTGSSNHAATPPLHAVPGLSYDSSATSTASSLDDVPPRPLHSANSSVVTEIYAPQSPSFPPEALNTLPEADHTPKEQPKEQSKEQSLHLPADEQPPFDDPPQLPPSVSPFSSFHTFSALLNPTLRERRKKRSHTRPRHETPSERIAHPASPTATSSSSSSKPTPAAFEPRTTQPRLASSSSSRSPTRSQHTPYKRIQPIYSTDSLASLSLAHHDGPEPGGFSPSHNPEILPWEYPVPQQPSRPEAYNPRGFSVDHARAVEDRARKPSGNSWAAEVDTASPTLSVDAYIRAEKDKKKNKKPTPPSLHHPPQSPQQQHPFIPARRSSSISYPRQHLDLEPTDIDNDDDSLFAPIFSEDALDVLAPPVSYDDRQPLSHASSFDSVAPPPIRRGPRDSMTPGLQQQQD
ncbi:MAG: hypothetical protein Q9207_005764, partial [Kuettlingeria erythrocarpa]